MSNPKVSVVIPTYNCEKYISDAIKSVLNQTFHDFEIILVDDGSTDKTATIVTEYLIDKRVKYFYKSNNGQASARNYGIRKAQGEIIAFLDADDTWLPTKLEYQVPLFDSPQIGASHTGFISFDSGSNEILPFKNNIKRKYPLYGKILPYLIVGNFVTHSTLMTRKKALEDIGGFDETIKMGDDWDVAIRLSANFEFGYVDKPLTRYRVGRPSSISEKNQMRFGLDERIVRKYISQYRSLLSKPIINAAFARMYRERGYYFSDKNFLQAIGWFFRAAILQPANIISYKGTCRALYNLLKGYKKKKL